MYKLVKLIIRSFCKLSFRIKKINEDNIPKEGSYIICANHISNWDPVILITCTKRKICFLAKEELYKSKFFVWLANLFEIYPVKRDQKDIESIKNSIRVLKEGKLLGLFPEGTRNGLEKNGKAKSGAAYMSIKTGTKVIPVGITATYKRFSKVRLNYGKPMDFSEYKKANDKEALEEVSDKIMKEIIRLTKEEI